MENDIKLLQMQTAEELVSIILFIPFNIKWDYIKFVLTVNETTIILNINKTHSIVSKIVL